MSSSDLAALLSYIAISGLNPFPPGSDIVTEAVDQLTTEDTDSLITD